MIRVVIADDQTLIRESLKIMIDEKQGIRVVDTAENGEEAVELAKKHNPDIMLMDIRMPKLNGVECTEIIKKYNDNIKIIILTTFNDDEYIFNALKNGASGYILKSISTDKLIESIVTVYKGGALINPEVAKKVLQLFSKMAQADYKVKYEDDPAVGELTEMELNIVKLIGIGEANREISFELNLSEGTVKNYISDILKKLDLKNRTQIAIFAVQNRLVL